MTRPSSFVGKRFIYEYNGEVIPSALMPAATSTYKSGVTGKKNTGNTYKYMSRKEKKRLKASRRRVRRELKECVTTAIAAGVTSRKVLEQDGTIWTCGKCGNLKKSDGTFGSTRDAKWFIWCKKCQSTVQHIRPEVLFDLLVE